MSQLPYLVTGGQCPLVSVDRPILLSRVL
ncbi:hypothetical protein MY5147_009334, partial [Beauveria neobassiana]